MKLYILVLIEKYTGSILSFAIYKKKSKAKKDMNKLKETPLYKRNSDEYEIWDDELIE